MITYCRVLVAVVCMTFGQFAHAKWDEERDVTTNGKEEFVYYYKTNEQGQKLVLDKYIKRLIFIQKDRFRKRVISQIKIDGLEIDVMSDPFSHYPEQTAITFDNKDEVLKKLFLAKKIEVYLHYGREPGMSTFQIK
ncbi:hypothetical protein ICN46_01290 [Polynucleobacter sp. Latsch14-2]|jgi:hypothetical protein|uniref:hypothetical protein n=1 Tax=Polynucleobacter sp. Latsch14-2 TaxID=2576920 RepID=UPI001C0D4F7D|nr:hypothetical protein [Polynucleobacter sp. Latsch14-2]MBU3613532.1 hypothetical protein [Polynucleobacter sp. Latsch14-2]